MSGQENSVSEGTKIHTVFCCQLYGRKKDRGSFNKKAGFDNFGCTGSEIKGRKLFVERQLGKNLYGGEAQENRPVLCSELPLKTKNSKLITA